MFGATSSLYRFVLLAMAAMVIPMPAAQALHMRELAGWWIAIDDTFPKLWQREAISPMEEILQINPDGRVQDRVMNFWAGSPQVCLGDKVCSELPLIGVAQLRVNGDRIAFVDAVPSKARLDIGAGDAVIRRAALIATEEWTIRLEGERMTLRSSGREKVRVLARIDPERLRRLHAGMRAATWPAAEHWRCFLAVATAADSAFAPLRNNRRHQAPAFLDRYLKFASYIGALQSTVLLPAIDESDPERRKLLGAPTEELLVQHYDNLLRPPTVDDRARLEAVLTHIYQHARAINAASAAAAAATLAKARADAAAQEAAKLAPAARSAAIAAGDAQAKASSATADHEKAKATAEAQAQAASTAELAAREAAATAAALQAAAEAAATLHNAAQESAAARQRHSATIAAAAQKLSEAVAAAREAARDSMAVHLRSALQILTAAHDATKAEVSAAADEAAQLARAAQNAQSRASEALAAARNAAAARDQASAKAEAAAQEAATRAQEVERAAEAANAAQDAARLATTKAGEAKARHDAAVLEAAKTAATAQAAVSAARAAQEALKTIASAQPKSEGLPPIAGADIAALARVLGDSDETKALFCRDGHGAPNAVSATPSGATSAHESSSVTGTITVPLPLARPAPRR
jgi:hypothetical protein